MAPSLFNFRELRRRSRASFRTDVSTDTSSDAGGSHGTAPTTGSLTPPSVTSSSDPSLNLPDSKDSLAPPSPAMPRPPLTSHSAPGSIRNSVSSMNGLGYNYPPLNRKPSVPLSQYAPRVSNISENAWVYQKAILLHGTIGDPAMQAIDGTVSVSRLDDSFPQINWPVCSSHFKALVYLQPGANRIRLEFTNPKLRSSAPVHVSCLTLHMLPPTSSPPLQLAILVAKDSPETFDAMPARIEREGNDLDLAVRKFRMAAYLWQAFTAEQMFRNRLGRRAFRFEEEWMLGSSAYRDAELCTMRSEARVHIIRTDKTVEEIQDLDKAQQYGKATKKNDLFDIAAEAVKNYFKPLPGQKQYVSVLILDAHWDTEAKTIRGHAALGGSAGANLQLAVFGSHCLQSYPASFEEVVPAFTDCTPTDTNHVANDCNQAGSSWEAANIGIGAHLHEVGHLFGCPHQESGVMLRDYVTLNRSFVAREAYCTRTRSRGGPVAVEDECKWHRLDCLRFRSHPCFRLPNDPVLHPDSSVQTYPVDNNSVAIMATTGISFLEVFTDGDDVCRTWIEYPVENGIPQRQIVLSEQELRARVPEKKRATKLKVCAKSYGGGSVDIPDFKALCSKESAVKLGSTGRLGFRGQKVGLSRLKGSVAHEVVFMPRESKGQSRVVSKIAVFHGKAVDGLEFIFDDGSVEMFGKKGGKPGGDIFEFDIRRGEYLTGFHVRAGAWLDGIQILTSVGRKSPIFGHSQGGSPQTLIPPSGYNVAGVSGTCGAWLDGFSLIISR